MLISVKLYRIIYELFAYPKRGYYICTRISKRRAIIIAKTRINLEDSSILKRTLTYKQFTKLSESNICKKLQIGY